jgi:hypothetical protein
MNDLSRGFYESIWGLEKLIFNVSKGKLKSNSWESSCILQVVDRGQSKRRVLVHQVTVLDGNIVVSFFGCAEEQVDSGIVVIILLQTQSQTLCLGGRIKRKCRSDSQFWNWRKRIAGSDDLSFSFRFDSKNSIVSLPLQSSVELLDSINKAKLQTKENAGEQLIRQISRVFILSLGVENKLKKCRNLQPRCSFLRHLWLP